MATKAYIRQVRVRKTLRITVCAEPMPAQTPTKPREIVGVDRVCRLEGTLYETSARLALLSEALHHIVATYDGTEIRGAAADQIYGLSYMLEDTARLVDRKLEEV